MMEILSSVAQPSENMVCSFMLLSLQGEACLPQLGKHQVRREGEESKMSFWKMPKLFPCSLDDL